MSYAFPIISPKDIPFITVEQMIKVDELMIGKYHISLEKMMENAGLNLAALCTMLYPKVKTFYILAGKGNNGGGGLVAARRLHNWGFDVKITLASKKDDLKETPLKQLLGIKKLKVQMFSEFEYSIGEEALILDALLGYSLKGNPREKYASLISQINESNLPVVSLDIPSGIEGSKGTAYDPAVQADNTMTLALPKSAFLNDQIKKYIGRLFVADISVPNELYNEINIGVKKTLFQDSTIIEVK
jgi:NAD(P)H-hydrate epimerase